MTDVTKRAYFGRWTAITGAMLILCELSGGPAPAQTPADAPPAVVRANAISPLSGLNAKPIAAIKDGDFLNSIGANSAVDTRGETLANTIESAKYAGVRWFRITDQTNLPTATFAALHDQAGACFSWGLGSGGSDLAKLISSARALETAAPGSIVGFEGPNEPNNWSITYQGQVGGGSHSWLPLAKMQSDMYRAVKSDPLLKHIPVWGISECGAETDNVGLQFLTIPPGANCLMPDGTKFSDYANCHNYFYHSNSPNVEDNKTWDAADPSPACRVDGLYGEYGVTWGHHYDGYSVDALKTLPRVTTETGAAIGGNITEQVLGLNVLTLYLDQFKRGWSFTSIYLLRDRTDESGNQQFGLFRPDYTPRLSAVYLHNLTTILADDGPAAKPRTLRYTVVNEPATVHDMLLEKSDGTFELLAWDENVDGSNTVDVDLGRTFPLVNVFDPTVGVSPIQQLHHVKSIRLVLTDHPAVIELPA